MALLEKLGLKPRQNLLKDLQQQPAVSLTGVAIPPATGSPVDAAKAAVSGVGAKATAGNASAVTDMVAFQATRVEVLGLLAQLDAHPQKASVQTQITQAKAKLAQADARAAAGDIAGAQTLIEEARTICQTAKKFADDLDLYNQKRKVVVEQIFALKRLLEPPQMTALINALKAVDAELPNFAQANADMDAIATAIAAQIKPLVDDVKARMTRIAALDARAQAFAATEMTEAKKQGAEAAAALAAKDWSRCLQATIRATEILAPVERMVTRRGVYEVQRAKTVQAVTAMKGVAAVKDKAADFDAIVAQGDAMASRDTMQFEEATKLLEGARIDCLSWIAVSPNIDAYVKQKSLAEAELAALKAGPAAKQLATAIAAAAGGLATAAKSEALAVSGKDPVANWNAALTTLLQARGDIAQAKATADALGPALAARGAAADPKDLAALRASLKSLRDDAAAAQAAPFAALVAAEFARFKTHADKAGAALDKDDGKAGAAELAPAADALLAAKTIQSGHAAFVPALAKLEARQKTLAGLANAASIKARLDAVDKALTEARAFDKVHAAPEAMAALRRAEEAAAAAEKADHDRTDYNTKATATSGRVAAVTDAKLKAELGKLVDAAKAQADAFKFDVAAKALQDVEVRLDEIAVKAMAGKTPPDPDLAKTAASMVANGGAAKLDALLQGLPPGTSIAAATAIAKGRFGIEFTGDAGAPSADELKTLKAICKMLATVPQDVVGTASLKGGIKHTDATGPNTTAGAYAATTASISLIGRPGPDKQKLGDKLTIKVAGVDEPQLPAVDPDCKPKNPADEPDFLDWATLHEVGHGVDDANAYMQKNGHKPEMGGWHSYGSNVQPIADAVGAHFGLYSTPAEKKYVLDTIMSKPAVAPPAGAAADWAAKKTAFDNWYSLATMENIYRVQSKVKDLSIGADGVVYQEAYAQNWVSYLADARKKGITGYQFRAPGEWFAELYAAYKMGKLGDKHPALAWLKKLSK